MSIWSPVRAEGKVPGTDLGPGSIYINEIEGFAMAHKSRVVTALTLSLSLSLSLSLIVGFCPADARQIVIQGDQAKENIKKVNSNIKWHTSLNSALMDARKESKMVLWVHLVGKMDGAT
ncbi:MAG: hypothetical protein IPM23_12565 [Candidatus Melainabacteria bacterium]|nr:hypothetical protein [Candidatus Melainabacteria bacterium]